MALAVMLLAFFFSSVLRVFCLTTITAWHRETDSRYGTVDYYDRWGWAGGYNYGGAQSAGQSTTHTWNPWTRSWDYSGSSACQGQLYDYVNGQQRFFCYCNGGQSFQIGGCR